MNGTNFLVCFYLLVNSPITETFPATEYVGIDQKIMYDTGKNAKLIMNITSGITDTGTTLILIASGKPRSYTTIEDLPQDATLLWFIFF